MNNKLRASYQQFEEYHKDNKIVYSCQGSTLAGKLRTEIFNEYGIKTYSIILSTQDTESTWAIILERQTAKHKREVLYNFCVGFELGQSKQFSS